METAIKIEGLSKQYPSQKKYFAIDNVDLEIPRGILFGLVGPDGAGKTTILRILSSVMEQTSGQVTIDGFDVRKQAEEIRTRIGYMPQNFSLYPDLSVSENLDFFANIQQVPTKDRNERIATMLAFTHLEEFGNRRAGQLSGGMKKKLALACAMVHAPQVLILDEPSTGVDPVSRREFWILLAHAVSQGVTVVVSTPYMDEAERCHQVGILYQGKLLKTGSPEEITSQLPFEVVEVNARPRKKMREIVSEMEGILEWHPVGDSLRLAVSAEESTKKVMKKLANQFEENKMEVFALRPARRTMEDAFVHLLRSQKELS
jgi:ABC-2 type transport system ATP-binding protein